MHKWSCFSMGLMAGIIAVLLTILVMRDHEPTAYAAPSPMQSVDNTGAGLMVATGGSTNGITDILWVIHKRAAGGGAASGSGVTAKDQRTTLMAYQVANGGRFVKLIAVRDISYDMDLIELNNDRPSVKTIVDALKKQQGGRK